jgi:hypothetical protein
VSCTEVMRQRHAAPIMQPIECTGDLTNNKSEHRPIKIEPHMPPTELRDMMLVV